MMFCSRIIRVDLDRSLLCLKSEVQFAHNLWLRYLARTLQNIRMLKVIGEIKTYSLLAPDTSLDSHLGPETKEFLASRRTCAPSQKHFVHFATGIVVNHPVSVEEKGNNEGGEYTGIRFIDVLRNCVKKIESREFHPRWDLKKLPNWER